MPELTVTVVIPTFNRAHCIRRALASVYNQSRMPEKILLVDDGSTDSTQEIVQKEFPQVDYFRQSNSGVSSARNLGIRHSKTDLVALLDSDDEWLPQKLERQILQLQQQPHCILSHTDEIWVRNGVRVNQMTKHQKFGGRIYQKCLPLCVISPSSVIIRKQLFNQLGYFDESLPACEDYDLWLRACSCFSVAYISDPLIVKYGGHDDQLSRKYWGMDRYRITALQKMLDSGQLQQSDYSKTLDMLRNKCKILIKGARKRGKTTDIETYCAILAKYDN